MTDPGDASRGGGDGWHSFFDDRVHVSAGCDIPNALYGWPPVPENNVANRFCRLPE